MNYFSDIRNNLYVVGDTESRERGGNKITRVERVWKLRGACKKRGSRLWVQYGLGGGWQGAKDEVEDDAEGKQGHSLEPPSRGGWLGNWKLLKVFKQKTVWWDWHFRENTGWNMGYQNTYRKEPIKRLLSRWETCWLAYRKLDRKRGLILEVFRRETGKNFMIYLY